MLHNDDDYVSPTTAQANLLYRTRDLYEASVIHSFQMPVISVEREDDGVCYFLFEDKARCERLVHDFRNRNLMVNAKAFMDSIRAIKDFIYSGEQRRS